MKTVSSKCGCADEDSRNACCPFIMAELRCVMNKLKIGKAAGANEISNEMLKRLGDRGTAELLRICNMSWINKTVPADWRRATIIPILKSAKPPNQPGSYRPISLTSCTAKLMERLEQERLS